MKTVKRFVFACLAFSVAMLAAACNAENNGGSAASVSTSPADFQKKLQEDLIKAKPGSVIELPAGKFKLDKTLSLNVDKVTVRGKGMDKTVLSFTGQNKGSAGMLVKANDFTIEDLAIEDAAGDALKIENGTNIAIRRVRVEWTAGPKETNGPYGIYPVT
ncbi:MAG TPA: parallel beta-helix domain-containing protein, partial [Blastocatellia bacterium]|nr:parallel beta-helix domain-containing protein [Blastocatellia bacterium]